MDGSHTKDGIPLEPEGYRWNQNRIAVCSDLLFRS